MIKKLSLLATAFIVLTGTAVADQTATYKVIVSNNTNPGFDLYLTEASEMSGCKVFWPDSKLPIGGATTFKLECNGNLPPALKLSLITQTTQQKGQTCWGTYDTSQFISDSTTNIAIHPNFTSFGTCGTSLTPPVVLPNHPAPPTN